MSYLEIVRAMELLDDGAITEADITMKVYLTSRKCYTDITKLGRKVHSTLLDAVRKRYMKQEGNKFTVLIPKYRKPNPLPAYIRKCFMVTDRFLLTSAGLAAHKELRKMRRTLINIHKLKRKPIFLLRQTRQDYVLSKTKKLPSMVRYSLSQLLRNRVTMKAAYQRRLQKYKCKGCGNMECEVEAIILKI